MTNAATIIDALGGSAAVSRATGFPLTTIESWKRSNFIPEWRQPSLISLAKKAGAKLKAADFPSKEDRRTKQAAA